MGGRPYPAIDMIMEWRSHVDGCLDLVVDGQVVGFWTGHGSYLVERHGGLVFARPMFGPPREQTMQQLERVVMNPYGQEESGSTTL